MLSALPQNWACERGLQGQRGAFARSLTIVSRRKIVMASILWLIKQLITHPIFIQVSQLFRERHVCRGSLQGPRGTTINSNASAKVISGCCKLQSAFSPLSVGPSAAKAEQDPVKGKEQQINFPDRSRRGPVSTGSCFAEHVIHCQRQSSI